MKKILMNYIKHGWWKLWQWQVVVPPIVENMTWTCSKLRTPQYRESKEFGNGENDGPWDGTEVEWGWSWPRWFKGKFSGLQNAKKWVGDTSSSGNPAGSCRVVHQGTTVLIHPKLPGEMWTAQPLMGWLQGKKTRFQSLLPLSAISIYRSMSRNCLDSETEEILYTLWGCPTKMP